MGIANYNFDVSHKVSFKFVCFMFGYNPIPPETAREEGEGRGGEGKVSSLRNFKTIEIWGCTILANLFPSLRRPNHLINSVDNIKIFVSFERSTKWIYDVKSHANQIICSSQAPSWMRHHVFLIFSKTTENQIGLKFTKMNNEIIIKKNLNGVTT